MTPRRNSSSAAISETSVIRVCPSRPWRLLDIRSLWAHRELIYFLAWRDIKVRYKQATLGVTWILLQPVVTIVVFSLLFGRLLKVPSGDVPYPLFAYAALLPWTFFASAVTRASNSLVGNANLITKVYFPRLVVPMSAILAGLVDLCISFVVLCGFMLYYRVAPTWQILWLPAFVLLAVLAALGVSLWLSALNVRYRDIGHAVPFLIQIWMYLTPVVYGTTLIPERLRFLLSLNPMTTVVEGFRWAILRQAAPGASTSPWILVSSLVGTALVLVTGLAFFARAERTFADIV
jgi:lipopolysaccharide transport system permease protein